MSERSIAEALEDGGKLLTELRGGNHREHLSVQYYLQMSSTHIFSPLINTDCTYETPEPLEIPVGTCIPIVDKNAVTKLLTHQKRTASGPDEFPYWFWRDFSHHLAPVIMVITAIFNSSLIHQVVPTLEIYKCFPYPQRIPSNGV